MIHDCQKDILELYQSGKINDYAKAYLSSMCEEGLDDELWEEAMDDMILASSMGVSSEDEFRLFFYIDHFAEELIDEIFGVQLSEEEEDSLKKFMFNKRTEVNFDNLTAFRVAVLQWLKSHNKLEKGAYIGSSSRSTGTAPYYLKRYSMENWTNIVSMVNKLVALGSNKKQALKEAVANLKDPIERLDFLAWYSFKFGSNKKLYDINKDIQKGSEGTMTSKKVDKFAGIYEDALSYYVPKEVFKKEQDAISHEYTPVTEEAALAEAQKKEDERIKREELEMARAKLLSRTFAIDKLLQKHHSTLGADQIDALEDALNALRKQVRKLSLASTIDDCIIRTASIMDNNGFEEGGTMLRKLADKHGGGPDLSNKEELNNLLDKLTEISTFLKQRSIVRDIAETDLKLYNMELASLFPELTEASSKLIEAYTYASNKIDDLIPKLRGSVEKAKKEKAPEEDIPLKLDKKDKKDKKPKEKEERVPLDFPKEKDLKVLDKEPEVKLDDLTPDEPAKQKPKALLDLEKAISD